MKILQYYDILVFSLGIYSSSDDLPTFSSPKSLSTSAHIALQSSLLECSYTNLTVLNFITVSFILPVLLDLQYFPCIAFCVPGTLSVLTDFIQS